MAECDIRKIEDEKRDDLVRQDCNDLFEKFNKRVEVFLEKEIKELGEKTLKELQDSLRKEMDLSTCSGYMESIRIADKILKEYLK